MQELIMDYFWANKYLLIGILIIFQFTLFQQLQILKLRKKVNGFESWSKEIYNYLENLYQTWRKQS
mgnify:FL=1